MLNSWRQMRIRDSLTREVQHLLVKVSGVMSKPAAIRNPRAYQLADAKKKARHEHTLNIIKSRIEYHVREKMHKIMGAKSKQELVLMLAIDRSIIARLPLRSRQPFGFFKLVQEGIDQLVRNKELWLYEDNEDVVLGCPNVWPPQELQADIVTIEDLDPVFDWASLDDAKCPPVVWRTLAEH